MTHPNHPFHDLHQSLSAALEDAVSRVIGGDPLASFCEWFVASAMAGADPGGTPSADEAALARRTLITLARSIWSSIPMPGNRWRTQTLPKVERNDPCYCGSGRKFKQCCAELAGMPKLLEPEHALRMVAATLPPSELTGEKLRQMPPGALATAAMGIQQEQGDDRVVELLEPLFLDPAGLNERHEDAFDVLMDSLQTLGLETRRDHLVRVVGSASNKVLATSARCRHVSMLADRGEYDAAWKLFHEVQRVAPNDPQLMHLEMLTLLSQGREPEAQLRAPLLAAQARKLGYPELAALLVAMARDGISAVNGLETEDEHLDDDEQCWVDLLASAPTTLDEAHCRSLYTLERLPPMEDGTVAVLGIHAQKALAAIERRWRKRFPVEVPMMVSLDSDAWAILDEPHLVQEFLRKYPDAWLSVQVQNDLLLAARQMEETSGAHALLVAARSLAAHAMRVCRALVVGEPCHVPWNMLESRPFLRNIALTIEFARQAGDNGAAEPLMRWALALNPHDNHGWGDLVIERCLDTGNPDEALQWLDRYPHDLPPAGHQRALALFLQHQTVAAEQALRSAHAQSPRIVPALLADLLDQPPDDGGPGVAVGGEEEAFFYRASMRPAWVRSGALAWLRALKLPAPPSPARTKRSARAESWKDSFSVADQPDAAPPVPPWMQPSALSASAVKRLKKLFPDYARLRGYLTAIAWSPGMVMPNIWLAPLMEILRTTQTTAAKAPTLESMNEVLGDLMNLYNHFNSIVLTHDANQLPDVDATRSNVCPWAAGFVQGAEQCASHWRSSGFALKTDEMPFKALYALAAQAGAKPSAWRATDNNGQVLLTGVAANPPPPAELLTSALKPLWQVIAPIRQQRIRG